MEDAGKYTIKASNDGGSVSADVEVTVTATVLTEAPRMLDAPKPISVKEGDTITIACKIAGQSVLKMCLQHLQLSISYVLCDFKNSQQYVIVYITFLSLFELVHVL